MRKKMSRSMKGLLIGSTVALAVGGIATGNALATNGDNLIGIGPISRAMGGVGVAAPQDAISAVFANPAGMCFGPYCPGSELNFAGTVFDPTVKATLIAPDPPMGFGTQGGKSQADPYIIPAVGMSMPINPTMRFGLALYGVSGLGVDYRNQIPDLNPAMPGRQGVTYTQYQVLKFAPNLAYMVNDKFSIGASLHIGYAALDLEQGTAHGYTGGIQLGVLYKTGPLSFGASYVSAQEVDHKRVYDFTGDGLQDNLKLEAPQNLAFGVAYQPNTKFLIEIDTKWLNWSDAKGYKDFDWDDQWVFAIGAQYKPNPKWALRAGYNYGKNPVKEHNGWDATDANQFGNEVFRIIGFPAIVESHLGLGLGYMLTDTLELNLGYMHAFETKVRSTSSAATGSVVLESSLSEDSYEFGITKRF